MALLINPNVFNCYVLSFSVSSKIYGYMLCLSVFIKGIGLNPRGKMILTTGHKRYVLLIYVIYI